MYHQHRISEDLHHGYGYLKNLEREHKRAQTKSRQKRASMSMIENAKNASTLPVKYSKRVLYDNNKMIKGEQDKRIKTLLKLGKTQV